MHWNPDPLMLQLGQLAVFWYGFLFTCGLFATIWMGHRFFVERGLEERHASNMTFWLIAGLFIGAHLGELFFYNWDAFMAKPAIVFDPRIGLSSHGGAVGVITVVLVYARVYRIDVHRLSDAVTLAAVWLFPFIRTGNFMNSEVVGRPTDMPWGVVFVQLGESQARHPSQLYEAALGVTLIVSSFYVHRRYRHRLRKGVTSHLILGSYFAIRFLLEFFKERQAVSPDFPLNMGQLLSAPGALAFGALVWFRRPILVEPGSEDAADPRPEGATDPIGAAPDADGASADEDAADDDAE